MLSSKHGRLAFTIVRGIHSKMKERVCVIGAGPSGMNILGMMNKLKKHGRPVEVTCYEKQSLSGGIWNFTWRTGTDEFGEPVHCSQYQDLFCNGPKECLELPTYTFIDHFGKNTPSFLPREALLDYLRGYWRSLGVFDEHIKTNHCVRDVKYDRQSKLFTVRVTDLLRNRDEIEEFDYMVVASGHYSTPHTLNFAGMDQFKGRVLHAHEFRNAREFQRKHVLVIGSAFSGEDLAMQCYKFGAASVTISHRSSPMMYKWPQGIEEVPILTWVDGNTCHFKDGSMRQIDAIIQCTGYKHHFPFMQEELRLVSDSVLYPPNLYQGLQWHGVEANTTSADGKLFYLAMNSKVLYTFPMFMLQGLWVSYMIKGILKTPPYHYCAKDIEKWKATNKDIDTSHKEIESQTAYIQRLANAVRYQKSLDASKIYYAWEWDKLQDIMTYRDKSYTSMHTGHLALPPKIPWLQCYDDSLKAFLSR